MAHQKHPRLARRPLGHYAPVEFSLVGTTCARIDGLLGELRTDLRDRFNVLTVMGSHADDLPGKFTQMGTKRLHREPAVRTEFDDRMTGADLALVNGNHFPAARQIVFIDPAKAGTLERRREQLTDVAMIVLCPGQAGLPEWLQEHLARQEGARPPVRCEWQESKGRIGAYVTAAAEAVTPPLKALILAGGKSTRMGEDKASLVYGENGVTELERMTEMLEDLDLDVHLSVADAEDRPESSLPKLADRFPGMGAFGAILTAHLHDPTAAWLVLACDLPLLTSPSVVKLIENRDTRRVATALQRPGGPFPEPLVAIYEPRAYARLLQFLALGYACPRKMLINSDVRVIELADGTPLTNANTPEERSTILGR